MTRKTVQAIIYVVILAVNAALKPTQAIAQQPQHPSHKQLRLLVASAANADDYQKLAAYFHYRELMFRTTARRAVDEFAIYAGKYPMATKTITRAEATARLHGHYSFKADENAGLAAQYDEMLTEIGVTPARESCTIVSIESLLKASHWPPTPALLETSKQSSKPTNRAEH